MNANQTHKEAVWNYIRYGKPIPVPPETIQSLTQKTLPLKELMSEEQCQKVQQNPDLYFNPYKFQALNQRAWANSILLGYTGAWALAGAIQYRSKKGVSPFHFIGAFIGFSFILFPLSRKAQGYVSEELMSDYAQLEKKMRLLREKN